MRKQYAYFNHTVKLNAQGRWYEVGHADNGTFTTRQEAHQAAEARIAAAARVYQAQTWAARSRLALTHDHGCGCQMCHQIGR